jgi:hypothetical protein
MIGFELDDCRKALESYAMEIEELMTLVERAVTLTPQEIGEARTQLGNLKSCLRRDHKLRDTYEGRAKMTQVETAVFAPAVHQVLAGLHVLVNSRSSNKWYLELYGIQITIRHALARTLGKKDGAGRWRKSVICVRGMLRQRNMCLLVLNCVN